MRKWTAAFLLALALVLALGCLTGVSAADIVDSGYCGGEGDGTNLTWTLDSDGVLTISGTGAMAEYLYYSDSNAPWYSHSADIVRAEIGSGVTSIGWWAFYECRSLTSVTIPECVTYIGTDTFF